jgi:hypothetical protein
MTCIYLNSKRNYHSTGSHHFKFTFASSANINKIVSLYSLAG